MLKKIKKDKTQHTSLAFPEKLNQVEGEDGTFILRTWPTQYGGANLET